MKICAGSPRRITVQYLLRQVTHVYWFKMIGLQLFFPVRLARGLGTELAASDDRKRNNGRHVRNHLEELVRNIDAGYLQADLQSVAESEEEAGDQDSACAPAPEDDRCEGDEAAPWDILC